MKVVRFAGTDSVREIPPANNGRRVGPPPPQRWLSDEGVKKRQDQFRYSEKHISYWRNQLKLRLIHETKKVEKKIRFLAFVILAIWLTLL